MILNAADKATLFKTFTKIFAQRPSLWLHLWRNGQQEHLAIGHIHLSLKNEEKKNIFFDTAKPLNISDEMRWFIGGQQKLMPELMAMVAPTINSYRRLTPNYWAPIDNSWGIDNRTASLRVIPGTPTSQRVEYRLASADSNPYLAMSVALGSGFWGIENKIEPTKSINEAGGKQGIKPLPSSLGDASARLRKSKVARLLFGSEFMNILHDPRKRRGITQKPVDEWQLQRYFEII